MVRNCSSKSTWRFTRRGDMSAGQNEYPSPRPGHQPYIWGGTKWVTIKAGALQIPRDKSSEHALPPERKTWGTV